MTNPKMLSFCEMYLPIFTVLRGALRVEGKNMFLTQKKFKIDQKCSKFSEI